MENGDSYGMVSTDEIKIGPNIRTITDPNDQTCLVANVRENNVITPLDVILNELGEKEIVSGSRRLLAARAAGLSKVPVRIRGIRLSLAERIQQQLSIQLQHAPLNPMDEARAFDDLMKESGCSQSEVAKRIGVSVAKVSRCLNRLTLPMEIQSLVEQGKIVRSTVDIIASVKDRNRQAELAQKAAAAKLTRDEAVVQAKQPYVAKPVIVDAPLSEESSEEQTSQDRIQAVPEKPLPRRFSARLASGTVTITSAALEPQSVIGILTELLARARKLSARGVTGALFFKSLSESIKST